MTRSRLIKWRVRNEKTGTLLKRFYDTETAARWTANSFNNRESERTGRITNHFSVEPTIPLHRLEQI